MNFNDLLTLEESELKLSFNYEYSKLCDYIYSGSYYSFFHLENQVVNYYANELTGIVDLSNYSNYKELYVLIEAGLYIKTHLK